MCVSQQDKQEPVKKSNPTKSNTVLGEHVIVVGKTLNLSIVYHFDCYNIVWKKDYLGYAYILCAMQEQVDQIFFLFTFFVVCGLFLCDNTTPQ